MRGFVYKKRFTILAWCDRGYGSPVAAIYLLTRPADRLVAAQVIKLDASVVPIWCRRSGRFPGRC